MVRVRGALACCVALLVLAPVAHAAGFAALTGPPGFLSGFAASGDTWVALTEGGSPQAFASRDGASSWQPIPINGAGQVEASEGPAVGPDGALYLGVSDGNGGLAVVRMARGGSSFERVPSVLPAPSPSAGAGPPAWDEAGRMWVAIADGQTLTVGRVASDGSFQDSVSTSITTDLAPQAAFAGGKLYVRTAGSVFQLVAGALRQIQGGRGSFFGNWPVLATGQTILTSGGLSLDGGASFANRFGGNVLAIHGSPSLLVVQGFPGDAGGRVFTRFSPAVYQPTALTLPDNTTDVWQTSRGLVVLTQAGEPALSLRAGAIPRLTADARGITAVGRSMIARANYYRRAAGLPPLLGDRLIAKASLNHARYWSGRALPLGHLLDVHGETPGTRGFTGQTPEDRCKHVGGDCGSEVMNFGNQAEHPVDSWVATPYHRAPFISPGTVTAGAARLGRIAVMDFSFQPQNLVIAPVEFPRGRYSGPLVFPGHEAPDPLAACRQARQPLGPAPSIPVSFVPPVSTSKPPVVALFRAGRRVPGCGKVGFFMGRSQLAPHTRYTAKATWQAADGGAAVTTVWTFKTA